MSCRACNNNWGILDRKKNHVNVPINFCPICGEPIGAKRITIEELENLNGERVYVEDIGDHMEDGWYTVDSKKRKLWRDDGYWSFQDPRDFDILFRVFDRDPRRRTKDKDV